MFAKFEHWTNPFPEQDNEQPPKTLWNFIFYFCYGFKIPLLIIMLSGIVVAILEVNLFNFMGHIVDWLSSANRDTFLSTEKNTLITMTFLTVIALPFFNFIGTVTRHQSVMGNLPMSIRWRIHQRLLGQSLHFYQNEFSGRISAKVMQVALAVRQIATTIVDVLVYIVVYFVSIVVLMYQQHWILMVLMLVWVGIYACLLRYFLPQLRHASEIQSDARSLMTGRITDAYTNISTVKLFAHSKREAAYARKAMHEFLQTVNIQMRLVSLLNTALATLNYTLIFAAAAIGVALWLHEEISVGGIALATALALRLNGMAHWILWELGGLFEEIGTVSDGMKMINQPIAILDKPNAQKLNLKYGEISFENVCFSYGDNTNHVLNNLNLRIKAGEKIGLVGRSGAGKSTLVNSLLRFYDIHSGTIKIDGQDIANLQQDDLRRHIAMVTQDTSLLHRSVRENILYGKPDANEDELQNAINQAHAEEFISALTDPRGRSGLNAQVGERGVKLSGGQRQRVAIARVLLKNAPILILDEATSALDSEVEAAIQESLMRLMEGKTVIAIAHRLSTIAAMDRLIVLDKGMIVEEGSHEELLAKGGIYAQLWSRQTGGYLGE